MRTWVIAWKGKRSQRRGYQVEQEKPMQARVLIGPVRLGWGLTVGPTYLQVLKIEIIHSCLSKLSGYMAIIYIHPFSTFMLLLTSLLLFLSFFFKFFPRNVCNLIHLLICFLHKTCSKFFDHFMSKQILEINFIKYVHYKASCTYV